MAKPTFVVQMDEEEYRIVGPDGEEGDAVEYGDIAVLAIGSGIYYCHLEDPDAEAADVMRVDSISKMPTEVEEVEFQDADGPVVDAGPVLVVDEPDAEDVAGN
jgi:hypothetical protein